MPGQDGTAAQGEHPDPDRAFETTLPAGERGLSDRDQVEVRRAAEAEARALSRDKPSLGEPGPPLNRRSPYIVGMLGAAGVATTYVLLQFLLRAGGVIALIVLALFLAIGLDPAVRWLIRRGLPRWAAVTVVSLVVVGGVIGFFAAAIPPLVAQTAQFVKELPSYLRHLNDHSSTLGRLESHYHVRERASQLFSAAGGTKLFGGLLGAGMIVLDALVSTLTVLVLTIYLLADLPRIRKLIYRLVPGSRRPRAILLGDEMFEKIGGYVLGNLITSLIAAALAFVWLVIWHVPYPLLLSLMVALFDLIPVVGALTAGIIVTLVSATISIPVAIATAVYFTVYKHAEDYLLVPRIIGRTVDVPATATLVAVLIGGTALGIVGALIAIPVAASVRLLLHEVVFPRLDRT
ncbi:MAG TPA: AI-2E family transporter [Planosporangium sp.]|jgi:predicted PurR-regulated permease PerM|nr:AI-2E family transporter [Planosporangium sp.]